MPMLTQFAGGSSAGNEARVAKAGEAGEVGNEYKKNTNFV